jgi:hypothetical protein
MSLFTLTINNFATPLDKQHQEVQRIHSYLNLAAQDVRAAGCKHTSWNILGTPEQPSSAVGLTRHKHLRRFESHPEKPARERLPIARAIEESGEA